MSWRDWSKRQKLRIQLAALGRKLVLVKSKFQPVSALSSRMVANRVQEAASDYWKAVEAYASDKFDQASKLVSAGLLELDFITKLLEAETAERELGESVFFEYSDKGDGTKSLDKLEEVLELVSAELHAFISDCRRAQQ